MARPASAESEPAVAIDTQVVSLGAQALPQPTAERAEGPAPLAQAQPTAEAQPVSARIPWGSRIFAAPSMQQ